MSDKTPHRVVRTRGRARRVFSAGALLGAVAAGPAWSADVPWDAALSNHFDQPTA